MSAPVNAKTAKEIALYLDSVKAVFESRDAAAVAFRLWTEDAVYQHASIPAAIVGRANIEKVFAAYFAAAATKESSETTLDPVSLGMFCDAQCVDNPQLVFGYGYYISTLPSPTGSGVITVTQQWSSVYVKEGNDEWKCKFCSNLPKDESSRSPAHIQHALSQVKLE